MVDASVPSGWRELRGTRQHCVKHRVPVLRPDDAEGNRTRGRRSVKWCKMMAQADLDRSRVIEEADDIGDG